MTADPSLDRPFSCIRAAAAAVLVYTHGVTAFYTVRVLFSESTGAGSRDSFSVIGLGEWQLRYFCTFALYGEMIIFRLDRLRLGRSQINLDLPSACTTLRGQAPLRLAAPRQNANGFVFALGLHTLWRTSLRLDRLRLGKMQTSLFLPSACTIFVEPRTVCITSVRKNRIETEL